MITTTGYWKRVQDLRASLPKTVFLTPDTAGDDDRQVVVACTEVGNEAAAKCIAARTHRVATKTEIAAYQAEKKEHAQGVANAAVEDKLQYLRIVPSDPATQALQSLISNQPAKARGRATEQPPEPDQPKKDNA